MQVTGLGAYRAIAFRRGQLGWGVHLESYAAAVTAAGMNSRIHAIAEDSLRSNGGGAIVELDVRLGDELRGIIKKSFLGDSFALPALVSELVHPCHRLIRPFKPEDPANHHPVATNEYRADTLRPDRLGLRQNPPLIRYVDVTADTGWRLVFLHRGIRRIELFECLRMGILFDSRDE